MYRPNPIDTKNIELPNELLELMEKIAENVHDVWAEMRIKEGWVYGEKKDQELKTTPLLVKYSDLPESEKEYDRNTARETLKLIIKMGYEIKKQ
jgi:hypothetical protein